MPPSSAQQMMRSRYSAYAMAKPDYIIKTTHPKNREYKQDIDKWTIEICNLVKIQNFVDWKLPNSPKREMKHS